MQRRKWFKKKKSESREHGFPGAPANFINFSPFLLFPNISTNRYAPLNKQATTKRFY